MKIYKFSQQGKRSNNEDSLGTSAGLLTVCDGMGGHVSGERASAFVKEAMLKAFAEPQSIGKMEIQQQLNQVQADLNQLLEKEPELEKMGTTFTGVFITPDVRYAAHIGDSRIYLFRPSEQKLWHTWDHSLVGELMRTKEITVEAGRFHPMSNRIAKAIIAQKDGKPASASIVKIDELKKGDILLLCSDGVVEGWGDWELVQLFSDASISFEQKCEKLAQQCNEKSKDNNTAIIAEIEETDAFSFGTNEELQWTSFDEVEEDYRQYLKDTAKPDDEGTSKQEMPQASEPQEDIPQKKVEKPAAPHPQPAVAHQQTPKPMVHPEKKEMKTNNRLLPLLVTLLLLVVLGAVLILKGRKPKDDEAEFAKCKDVKDYREYVSDFGKEGKHYEEAVKFIEKYVSDSTIMADANAEKEAKKAENDLYRNCKTIEDCDNYLKEYPQGRWVTEVKNKKAELEERAQAGEAKQEVEATNTEEPKQEIKEPASNDEQNNSNQNK